MGCKKQMGFYEILTSRTKNSREETDDVNLTERVRGMPVHTDTEQKPHTRLPPSSPACRPQAPPAQVSVPAGSPAQWPWAEPAPPCVSPPPQPSPRSVQLTIYLSVTIA